MQKASKFEAFVFSAAGIKCIAYAGFLETLRRENRIGPLKLLIGSDTGSIVAALFAFGFSPEELEEWLIANLIDQNMQDGKLADVRLRRKMGRFKGDLFRSLIDQAIVSKGFGQSATFAELNAKKNVRLVIAASNVKRNSIAVFDHKTAPNMPVADAVRASMSIPYIFKRFLFGDSEFTTPILMEGYACPMLLADDEKVPTVSLKIQGNPRGPFLARERDRSDLYNLSLHVVMESLLDAKLANVRDPRVVTIEVPDGIQSFFFNIIDAAKKVLFDAGAESARKFVSGLPPIDFAPQTSQKPAERTISQQIQDTPRLTPKV